MPNNNLIITRRHGIAVGHCGHPIPEIQAAPTVVSSRQKASLQKQAYQKRGHEDPGSKCDRKIRHTCKEVCREPRALGSVLTRPFANWISLCFSLNLFVSTVGMATNCDNSSQHFLSSGFAHAHSSSGNSLLFSPQLPVKVQPPFQVSSSNPLSPKSFLSITQCPLRSLSPQRYS